MVISDSPVIDKHDIYKEDPMEATRVIGVDLGIASSHVAVICDETGEVIGRRQFRPKRPSLEALEAAALDGAEEGTGLCVVMEPTGAAWLPVAVFFIRRGHTVYRVSSSKASDLRKFFSRHTKTNAIDALTLAKMPAVDAAALLPLELPEAAAASLGRRVRAVNRLIEQLARHKERIRALARQVMPALADVVVSEIRGADLVVLANYGDPRVLAGLDPENLADQVVRQSGVGRAYAMRRAGAWISVAQDAIELYGDDPAVAFTDVAEEIASEIAIVRLLQAEIVRHEERREHAYRAVDPQEIARSLPGVGASGGPVLVAAIGRPGRFPNASSVRRFTGLAPRASETGNSDRKGQPMSKAGASWLRDQLFMSANVARRIDPQLAAIYYRQMVENGAHHTKAVCIVAAHLAERAWLTLARQTPYVLRDVDGSEVTVAEGKAIVAERYQVPDEVRRRRRSHKKTGKVPHSVLGAHSHGSHHQVDRRGDLPRPSTVTINGSTVKRAMIAT